MEKEEYKERVVDLRGDQNNLPKGLFVVGHKLFGVCQKCGSIVRLDKPIFGSYHLCKPD
jgi:hypothetical protein